MSWRQESAALARELAALAAGGSSVGLRRGQVRAALHARREVLFLLRRVLADVRLSGGPGGPVEPDREARRWAFTDITVGELHADPVGALERSLREHPVPRGRTADPASPGDGEGWGRVNSRAAAARLAWSQVDTAYLSAAERWAVVADVAALTEVVTVLDGDLLAAVRPPNLVDRGVQRALETATPAGLALAAREAGALSAAGDMADRAGPHAVPQPRAVTVVGSMRDLPAAQLALAAQLEPPALLRPQAVIQVAAGQARLLEAAAAVLQHDGRDPARADWARGVSAQLAGGLFTGHELAPAPGRYSAAPAIQTGEMLRCLRHRAVGPAGSDAADRAALAAAAERAPAVLQVLARRADDAWRRGQWLVRDRDPRNRGAGAHWRTAGVAHPDPALCRGLSAAAARASARTGGRLDPHQPVRSETTPPRELLPAVIRARRAQRPLLPSQRPDGRGRRT